MTVQIVGGGVPVLVEGGLVRLEEDHHYEVAVHGPETTALWLDRRSLTRCGPDRFALPVGRWVSPRALPLRHLRDGVELARVDVIVVPRKEKLSEGAWSALLCDIERWLPGVSVGTEGGKHGSVGTAGAAAPLIVEAVVPLVPALMRAIGEVVTSPRLRQTARWREEPLRRARRADREALRWVGRHPDVAFALDAWRASELVGAEPTLLQGYTEDRLDHPVNRYATWLLRRVVTALRSTGEALGAHAARADTPDQAEWCRGRAEHLGQCANAIERVHRRSFLWAVPPAPPTEAALLVLGDDPAYARLHHLGRRFVSPLFRLDSSADLGAAARPSFDLYEVWCFLALHRQLASVRPDLRWRSERLGALLGLEGTGSGAALVGTTEVGESVRIDFNPVFAGWFARRDRPRWSLSGERRPDLVVSRRGPGAPPRWVCLDAKWRAGRSNLAAGFESVHIYRDALRDDEHGGACVGAALLCPAREAEAEDWFTNEFRDRFGCGAFAVTPGVEREPDLARWVLDCLRGAW